MNKKISKLMILGLLIFTTINIYSFSFFDLVGITSTEPTFQDSLDKIQAVGELQDLITKALESQQNLTAFTKKLEDFVNEREEFELDTIKKVINYILYNPEISKYPATQKILTELGTRAAKPMTTMEILQVMQQMASDPQKILLLKENPEKTMRSLVLFVSERNDETKNKLTDLLNSIKVRKIFTDPGYTEQLDELIALIPQTVSLYEKIYTLYLKLRKIDSTEAINTLLTLMSEYRKATAEEKNKVLDKLELLLNSIIYSPKFSITQQQQALTLLNEVKKEEVSGKEPTKYSEKIDFYYKKALNDLTSPENKSNLLAGLATLSKEKMKAAGNDLQILLSILKFLQQSPYFTEMEKIQLAQFIIDIEAEVSVSDLIGKIYSLLGAAQTDTATRDYIVKLVEKAVNSLIEQIKKDKKIPAENETLKNLLTLYILESPTYAAKKADIEKLQNNLNTEIAAISQPAAQTAATTTISTDIRGRLRR
ncbi:MAG: hypothetical protein ABIA74_04515 [bacterium]